VLLELQSNDEPVWKYFDTHHGHILNSMQKAYQSSLRLVDGEFDRFNSALRVNPSLFSAAIAQNHQNYPDDDSLNLSLRLQLQMSVAALEAKKADSILGVLTSLRYIACCTNYETAKSPAEPVWQAIHNLVKNVSESILSPLPSFWKISKSFIDGKFKKVSRHRLSRLPRLDRRSNSSLVVH
jgi:exocyst complex component 2